MDVRTGRLLERGAELARLVELIERARAGRGTVVVIEGPAGIGKTTLARAAAEHAAGAGLRVLRGRAGQLEHDLRWNLVRQLFAEVIAAGDAQRREWLAGAAALAGPALGLSPGGDVGALHGLYWLTTELTRAGAAVLLADDLHWADLPSLRYLAYVAERIDDLPLLVLVTIRQGEPLPEPVSILAAGAETLRLSELSREAGAALAHERLGAEPDEAFYAACHQATGGNPFLLHELLAELARDGVEPSAEHATDVQTVTPTSVRRSVLLRLSRLPPDARELALTLAVLGEANLAEATALTGLSVDATAAAADALAETGIVQIDAPLRFAHPIVREVIYSELPVLQRSRRHRAAAQMLSERGEPDRAAAQLLRSEPEGDPSAVHLLRQAAGAALVEGAPGIAARLLERALAEPPPVAERGRLLVELAEAEAAAGAPTAAERMRVALELTSEPRERAGILLGRGRLLYISGDPGRAADAFDQGLRELSDDARAEPSLAAELTAGWLTAARLAIPLRARAEKLAYRIASDPPSGQSYGERALLAHVAGQLTFDGEPRHRPLELAHRALAGGDLIRQESADGVSWAVAMGAVGWCDDFDTFDAMHELAREDAQRRGSVIGFANALYGESFSHYYRGMLADAVADCEQAIAAESAGWRHFLPAARAQLAWALIELNEADRAAAELHRATADVAYASSSMQALVLEAQARVELVRGRPEPALEAALSAGEIAAHARVANPSLMPWRSRAALAAAALGNRDHAETLLGEELELARRFGAPRPIGVALMAAGVVRGGDGRDALEEAVETLAGSPARLEHVRATVLLGAALRRRGEINLARDRLRAGLDGARALGATLLEERARLELAAIGVRAGRRPLSGVDALTPAERRVAEAALAGLSNREIAQSLFVSLRTVETHLTHCYQKLGIDSRAELARALRTVA